MHELGKDEERSRVREQLECNLPGATACLDAITRGESYDRDVLLGIVRGMETWLYADDRLLMEARRALAEIAPEHSVVVCLDARLHGLTAEDVEGVKICPLASCGVAHYHDPSIVAVAELVKPARTLGPTDE
jgi:hypothetical protein